MEGVPKEFEDRVRLMIRDLTACGDLRGLEGKLLSEEVLKIVQMALEYREHGKD
jgi:hypothetical protein